MPGAPGGSGLLEALRGALAGSSEAERYRLVAQLFGELAERSAVAGPGGAAGEAAKSLSRKLQALGEQKAHLEDLLATTKADLAQRTAQLEAEKVRAGEDRRLVAEQRARLEAMQAEREQLEAELTAKNAAAHKAEVERDRLTLALQRAQAAGTDQSRAERLEAGKRELTGELENARAALERLRVDKDAEIDRLKSELARAKAGAVQGADAMLADFWQRLASAKPPLVEGHVPPNVQAGERLVDAFIELVRFVDEFDKSMRVFLDKYTKHHPSVKVPWEVYAKRDDVHTTTRQTIAVEGARPVGLLKMRLRVLYSWCQSAMIGADSALESIASELETQLRGPLGTESDPNRKVKDYLRDDGHYLFMEHIRELRSRKLAETFGRGG